MQDSEVKPPPGGSVVRTPLQPWAASVGSGTVVGVADGGAAVVDVVVGADLFGTCGAGVAVPEEHPAAATAVTTQARKVRVPVRLFLTDTPCLGKRWPPDVTDRSG